MAKAKEEITETPLKEEIVKTTVRVPKSLWDEVRIRAIQEGTSAEAIVVKLLAMYQEGWQQTDRRQKKGGRS